MNLLLFEDIFQTYFKKIINKSVKDETEILISEIFHNISDINTNTKLVLSKSLQEILQKELGNLPFYKEYITHILSRGLYKSVGSGDIDNDFTEEYIHINKVLTNPKLLLSLKKYEALKEIAEMYTYSQCIKPNKHWLAFSLAQKNLFSLYYFDFLTSDDLNNCFAFMLSLSSNNQYTIFDRNCNFDGDLFNELKKIKQKLFYYTYSKNNFDCIEKKKLANNYFNGGIKLYTTSLKTNIHERRIIFDNFVICLDEDFWNISIDKNTWKIDFIISKDITDSLLKKCSLFREYRGNY